MASVQKKLRADSKLAALSPELREELADMLLAGNVSQADALAWLGGHGITLSATSLSQYYRNHILPTKWQRMNTAAAILNKVDADAAAGATHRAVRQKVFELATSAQVDIKELAELYRLMIAGEKTEQDARRLELLERKAAQADAVRSQLENKRASGGLTPEALQLAEEALGLL